MSASIARASSGVAIASPSPSTIWRSWVHLRRVRLCQAARAAPEGILETHADIAAHRRRLCGDGHLVAAGAEHGPAIVGPKQAIGRPLHMQHILRMRANAAENPEHSLDEQRRLHQAAAIEMMQIVEMADIVALEFEARARLAEGFQDIFDVLERIAGRSGRGSLRGLPVPRHA